MASFFYLMLTIDIITLFPAMFSGPFSESILKIAQEKKKVTLQIHNLRDYTKDKHRTCDDKPFGGGPGMVMKPEPLFEAVEAIRKKRKKAKVVLFSPTGKTFDQKTAKGLLKYKQLIFICGHYEGIDERVHQYLADVEVSIGDFVLTGGELPAMCVVDTLVRLIPGVLGNADSIEQESFQSGLLDYPHYTRPRLYRKYKVPEVLLTGDHPKIAAWRRHQMEKATQMKRPDLWALQNKSLHGRKK